MVRHQLSLPGPGDRTDTVFAARPDKALREDAEAKTLGIETRPVLVGPATLLLLAKGRDGFRPFDRLDDLVSTYYAEVEQALARLVAAAAEIRGSL